MTVIKGMGQSAFSYLLTVFSCHVVAFLLLLCGTRSEYSSIDKSWLLLPRDVAFDSVARRELQRIRRKEQLDGEEQTLASSGNRNQATMTMVGYKGGRAQDQINQDRSFILSPKDKETPLPLSLLMGVCDGHGNLGHVVAEYSRQEIPKRLLQKIDIIVRHESNEETMGNLVKKALVDTFVEIDESIPNAAGHHGGCTASVVLQLGSKVYVANAGDSASVVAVYSPSLNTTQVVYVTQEDKPHLPQEYERIVRMGGTVYIPNDPMDDSSSRVIYTDPDTGDQVGLAMSRSIGDWEMLGVIAEPIVHVLDIHELLRVTDMNDNDASCDATLETGHVCSAVKDAQVFCISATDGMMDYVSPQALATSFAVAFYQPQGPHPLTVAEDMILTSAKGWNVEMGGEYRDDIAIAASKLNRIVDKEERSS